MLGYPLPQTPAESYASSMPRLHSVPLEPADPGWTDVSTPSSNRAPLSTSSAGGLAEAPAVEEGGFSAADQDTATPAQSFSAASDFLPPLALSKDKVEGSLGTRQLIWGLTHDTVTMTRSLPDETAAPNAEEQSIPVHTLGPGRYTESAVYWSPRGAAAINDEAEELVLRRSTDDYIVRYLSNHFSQMADFSSY